MNTRDDNDGNDTSNQENSPVNAHKSMYDTGKPSFSQLGKGYAPPEKKTTNISKNEYAPYPKVGPVHTIYGMTFYETSYKPNKATKPKKVTELEKSHHSKNASKHRRCLIS